MTTLDPARAGRLRRLPLALFALAFLMMVGRPQRVLAHDGPPYPIVSDRLTGPYAVSVWTDPDTTDDGSAGGQFWIVLRQRDGTGVPDGTRATVSIAPRDRAGTLRTSATEPVEGNLSRQFAAIVMDHEGWFRVTVAIDGPLGVATIDSEVEGTYDLRPAPGLLVLYMMPFVLIGFLWLKLVLRRRAGRFTPGP
jgi:hypothetical protein